MEQRAVDLNTEMSEIVSAAIAQGLGASAHDVVLLALRMLQLDGVTTPRDVEAELQAAATDLRPGKPADEVFARLRHRVDHVKGAAQANAA